MQKLICGRTPSDLITADPAVADLLHFTKRCRKAEMMHVLSGFYGANSRAYVQVKMTIFKTYSTKLPEGVDRLNTYNLDCMLHQVLLLKTKISDHLKTLETSVITACKGACDSKASSRERHGRNKNTKNTKSAFHTHAWKASGLCRHCCPVLPVPVRQGDGLKYKQCGALDPQGQYAAQRNREVSLTESRLN